MVTFRRAGFWSGDWQPKCPREEAEAPADPQREVLVLQGTGWPDTGRAPRAQSRPFPSPMWGPRQVGQLCSPEFGGTSAGGGVSQEEGPRAPGRQDAGPRVGQSKVKEMGFLTQLVLLVTQAVLLASVSPSVTRGRNGPSDGLAHSLGQEVESWPGVWRT